MDFDVRSVREEAELRFSFWLLLMAAKGKGWNRGIIMSMATFHISEAEAARAFGQLDDITVVTVEFRGAPTPVFIAQM